ncbi:esterase [Rhizobium glycinendophyticum]|uniref:Esterase n=2 Tax=Rhizobium glycinendophyticum TaxID=2589807 RepID=A0A504UHU3_9HYPH|nr:esterase [Rhizobium glycinendophyticum]
MQFPTKENAMPFNEETWICLSGGNALGAFHAGGCEALAMAGVEPTVIGGASAGALIGAIFAGNALEQRMTRMKEFWALAQQSSFLPQSKAAQIGSGLQTLMAGRPGLFHPHFPLPLASSLLGFSRRPSLFDTAPQRRQLERFIDFDRLNHGPIRFVVTAVDVESGELAVFDTRQAPITVDHLMASSAFPIAFPPVEIEGRHFADSGLVCNLPLEPLFAEKPTAAVTCLALDTATPQGPVPSSIDEALLRAQDILFAGQSRRALASVHERLAGWRVGNEEAPDSRVLYLPYHAEDGVEAGLKMLDFRADSVQQRWSEGKRKVEAALVAMRDERCPV